ncbi:MAG: hypothetical protein IPF54_26495 [Draconibacterium sp.]|nr:hypothetical protein [Draconibacterium sp.]
MKHFETEALFYLQIYSEMGEPCKTPEEKYNQLREFFENISKLPQSRIDLPSIMPCNNLHRLVNIQVIQGVSG